MQDTYKPIYLEWEDSASVPVGWETIESALESIKGPLMCQTMAWLIDRRDGVFILAMSITIGDVTGEPYMVDRVFTIPERCVRSMIILDQVPGTGLAPADACKRAE